ncbi:MAG: AMP-binding protein [Alphaproteobacteria bacterium]|nr:AMP-binding protein [Alphaproteobacteria bacterium]
MAVSLPLFLRRALPFFLVRFLMRLCFRVEVKGLDHLIAAGSRVLIVANHVSLLDALLLSAFLPRRVLFATQASIANRWWLKPYWHVGDAFSLDQNNPLTAKKMVDALKSGRPCMIFPEGRMTTTGGLMKVYESPGMIADKADAPILPVRIDGLQYSFFSNLDRNVRRQLFPKVTVTLLPAQRLALPGDVKGHKRRLAAGTALYDLMERALIEGVPYSTLLRQLMATRSVRGGASVAVEDAARAPMTHDAFMTRIFTVAHALRAYVSYRERAVGVMLPNGLSNAVSIFAIQALGRVTAMINFTSGPVRIVQACRMAPVHVVLSSRAFVEAQRLEPIVAVLEKEGVRLVYYEDLMASLTWQDRVAGFVKARLPICWAAAGLPDDTDGAALMLFTSGTEGMPKGVMLSHRNIIANGFQTGVRLGFAARDRAFACLPMFHSFGLTLGFFMPLFFGARTFLYPSPLRYHDIPELVYDTQSTLLLGTDTFLSNYEKHAAPHDFYFLRFAIGGAEKIKPATRLAWAEKFGVRLFEGYGTTETAPVVSVNSPLHYKAGTIGRSVSCLDIRLHPVEGIKNGAELVVRGVNVMLGYVKADRPGVIVPPQDGWYNTGDVVSVDADGFITILGRTKRFAKVAGEMVALGAVEAVVSSLWPDARHVAVGLPHDRRGEMIVLLTESDAACVEALIEPFRAQGLTELSLPREIVHVDQIPLLGSGKTDYVRAKELAEAALKRDA